MKSISFFNNKGGVGKTTLLCNVAAFLALNKDLKICVVDADPQCNATQYFFSDEAVDRIYSDHDSFTIYKIIEPLSQGEGYTPNITFMRSEAFNIDVIPGDPRLALTEDLLAKDWGEVKSGEIRGMKTNLVFSDLLNRLNNYDLVLFDVSPSLGAINRSILLTSDFFVSPMSIDIFSLRAFENIAKWINDWSSAWRRGVANVNSEERRRNYEKFNSAKFIGYVTQQYMAKRDASGDRRPVKAYENIRKEIDSIIKENFSGENTPAEPYEIGTVPNLFSLVPMSQKNHKPVFELLGRDGVVGAHFTKVKESKEIFGQVANEIMDRISDD